MTAGSKDETRKAVLAALTEPHTAAVKIGGREFRLTATPLMQAQRRRGTEIEWHDDTLVNAF